MATVRLVNVNKVYDGGVHAVHDFSIDIADKEFIVFVGPSGCGKSTTLRMIAGLEEISFGDLLIDGKLMNAAAPKDRDIAMVFQSYALYPQMTVYKNMAYALKLRKVPKDEIDKRVREAAKILKLTPYLDRKPRALSGGQRQRVALGRSIVRRPKVFLMDEPLSNLDAKLRVAMRSEIVRIHEEVGATTIYVTHDQTEAMTMSDRIVVMKSGGYVQQIGTPFELYFYPKNLFVAGFIGEPPMNFIRGTVENGILNACGLQLSLAPVVRDVKAIEGKRVVFAFRPEAIKLEEAPDSYKLTSKVELTELLGDTTNVYATVGAGDERTNIILKVNPHHTPEMGDGFSFNVPYISAYVFDAETEQIIENDIERH